MFSFDAVQNRWQLWKSCGSFVETVCRTAIARYHTIMSRETILVVDDDPEIVKILRDYLEQDGYAVLTAYSGRSALQRIQNERPDCVILDLMLPDQDGWTVTRTVRSDERVRDVPIIMLTARVDDTDKIIGLELGADDYVTKPFNPREVLARVRVQLRHAQREAFRPKKRFYKVAHFG